MRKSGSMGSIFAQSLMLFLALLFVPLADGYAIERSRSSSYEQKLRDSMAAFHINLNENDNEASGALVSLDLEWNLSGKFMQGRQAAVTAITSLTGLFTDLKAVDQYLMVDGKYGAVLYSIGGKQIADLPGIPNIGKSYNVLGAELMDYNEDAEVRYLVTVQEGGLQAAQLMGASEPNPNLLSALDRNPQTSEGYRHKLKEKMRSIHANVNAGSGTNNLQLVADDVQVNADGRITTGRQSFVDLLEADKSAFPNLVVHDDKILADGHLGAIEYVWQGAQTQTYNGPGNATIAATGKQVRVREMIFFSFDNRGLIRSVFRVRDESQIARQLKTDFIYPRL